MKRIKKKKKTTKNSTEKLIRTAIYIQTFKSLHLSEVVITDNFDFFRNLKKIKLAFLETTLKVIVD